MPGLGKLSTSDLQFPHPERGDMKNCFLGRALSELLLVVHPVEGLTQSKRPQRQLRGADTPESRNLPSPESSQMYPCTELVSVSLWPPPEGLSFAS